MPAGARRWRPRPLYRHIRQGALSLAAPRVRHRPAGVDRARARRAPRGRRAAAPSGPDGAHRFHRRGALRASSAQDARRLHRAPASGAGFGGPLLRRGVAAPANRRRSAPRGRPVRCRRPRSDRRGRDARNRSHAVDGLPPLSEHPRQRTGARVRLPASASAVGRDGEAGCGARRGAAANQAAGSPTPST
jgi:hypothetical protein